MVLHRLVFSAANFISWVCHHHSYKISDMLLMGGNQDQFRYRKRYCKGLENVLHRIPSGNMKPRPPLTYLYPSPGFKY